jgi:putative tricarboxylic transport membrane protein
MTSAPTPAGESASQSARDASPSDAAETSPEALPETLPETASTDPVVVRNYAVEAAFCALILALGLLVVVDSLKAGAGWADDGPQSGYFPFYIGLLLCLASLAQLGSVLRGRASAAAEGHTPFITRETLRNIGGLLIPLVLYVALIGPLGIYLASMLFIGFFMWRHGEQGPVATLLTAVGCPLAFFLMFERWFKVPLPKGPVEAWLGLV